MVVCFFLWRPNMPVNTLGSYQCTISMFLYSALPQQAFMLSLVYGPSRYNEKVSLLGLYGWFGFFSFGTVSPYW